MIDLAALTQLANQYEREMALTVPPLRIGRETFNDTYIDFYGGSFIADQTGELIVEADQKTQGIKIATLDIDAVRGERENWCYFRDRRPELYDDLLTLDAKR